MTSLVLGATALRSLREAPKQTFFLVGGRYSGKIRLFSVPRIFTHDGHWEFRKLQEILPFGLEILGFHCDAAALTTIQPLLMSNFSSPNGLIIGTTLVEGEEMAIEFREQGKEAPLDATLETDLQLVADLMFLRVQAPSSVFEGRTGPVPDLALSFGGRLVAADMAAATMGTIFRGNFPPGISSTPAPIYSASLVLVASPAPVGTPSPMVLTKLGASGSPYLMDVLVVASRDALCTDLLGVVQGALLRQAQPHPGPSPAAAGVSHYWPPALAHPVTLPGEAQPLADLPPEWADQVDSGLAATPSLALRWRSLHHRLLGLPARPFLRPGQALPLPSGGAGTAVGSLHSKQALLLGSAPTEASPTATRGLPTRSGLPRLLPIHLLPSRSSEPFLLTFTPASDRGRMVGAGPAEPLWNVHLAIPAARTPQEPYELHTVFGNYQYCHYGQELDDSGWGCAYRSLQTLVSWFRLQGYTGRPNPTHRQIQEALVAMNDKPAGFGQGRQPWIGSFEVGLVLEHWLEQPPGQQPAGEDPAGFFPPARIIPLASGAEFDAHVDELAEHFDRTGTPVMVGGGVLAYTLLGVALDRVSHQAPRYLILDPHYTGADRVEAIVAKGWVAWHPMSLFRTDVHYNLCLPQCPACI
ncbi:putative Ufm1-specific protease 2 [Paratrimastix pyriformis]|uniref:Ufm1-specific protease 2 n=1 Tax=Paratrimastix pyriformis TaxID=342808 RepID=A0ABQ8USA4_9EUKA|nr:putative Ufm1-specific protease 2 [Paratrimastix pyriformis]